MTREEQIEEAIRVRPSKTAIGLLRHTLDAMEAACESHFDRMEAGALRILIEMHDKLPPPVTPTRKQWPGEPGTL